MQILIAEDNIINQKLVDLICRKAGYQTRIVPDGEAAVEAMKDGGIQLVLMDVMMPEMDGLTATREIRKIDRWKTLPIIMLTAKAMAEDQNRCIEAGANDYLSKPLDVDKLLSLTRVWMPR